MKVKNVDFSSNLINIIAIANIRSYSDLISISIGNEASPSHRFGFGTV